MAASDAAPCRAVPEKIKIELDEELTLATVTLVRKYHISFYDAAYVALAKSLQCDLITADKKLVKAVNLPFVKLLM